MNYTKRLYKPPYEEDSLLIEVIVLSDYKKYKFKQLHNNTPFKIKLSPIEVEGDNVLEIHNDIKLWQKLKVKRIFLGGKDIFSLRCRQLLFISKLIHKYFPNCQTIGCLSTIDEIRKKTQDELEILHKAGYDGITIDVKTGYDKILELSKKDYNAEKVIKYCQRLEKANIKYNIIYYVGISGANRINQGARLTAEMLNVLHPQIILTSIFKLTIVSEIYKELKDINWKNASDLEKIRELKVLIRNLKIPVNIQILDSSEKVEIQGNLPNDKIILLNSLNKFIENMNDIEF